MNGIRQFIAISLSNEIHQSLDKVISGLRVKMPADALRWVPVHNIHLTLKFLGNVSASNQELLTKMLEAEVSRHHPFEISIGEMGVFPNIHRPRVLWIGVKAPVELFSLQHGIESEMARLGYPPDEKSFNPHLTFARTSRNIKPSDYQNISNVLDGSKIGFLGALRVRNVDLYRSDLGPSGAKYTRLSSFRLEENQT